MTKSIKNSEAATLATIGQAQVIKDASEIKLGENPCNNCYNQSFVPEPLYLLDLEAEVIPMIVNYKNSQHALITDPSNPGRVPDDARSVYFSLSKLKSFIYAIENQSCPCQGELGELGIRFYYGSYPASAMVGVDPSYLGMHTLVLVPTYTAKNSAGLNAHIDFCPDYMEGCKPISLHQEGAAEYGAALKKSVASSKSTKVMALIGGFDVKKARAQSGKENNLLAKPPKTKVTSKKNRPGVPDLTDPPPAHTLLNHGDLMPPPSKGAGESYGDATLLNC